MVSLYGSALKYEGNTEVLEFSFGGDQPAVASVVRVARMCLRCSDGSGLWFVGSLGHRGGSYDPELDHDHQFIGIYDSDELLLPELVASAYHYDHFVERLDYGHTFPLGPKSGLRVRGYTAAVILHGGLYEAFGSDHDRPLVAGVPTQLFAIVPLDQEELMQKRADGLDALLQRWDLSKKDVLHLGKGISA